MLDHESKVSGLQGAAVLLGGVQEVPGLDVAEDKALGVALRQEAQDGANELGHARLGQVGHVHGLNQRPAGAQLHHQVHVPVILKHILEENRIQTGAQRAHAVYLRADLEQVVRVGLVLLARHLGDALAGVLDPRCFVNCADDGSKASSANLLLQIKLVGEVARVVEHRLDVLPRQLVTGRQAQDDLVGGRGAVVPLAPRCLGEDHEAAAAGLLLLLPAPGAS
mmetsp:Transcript_39131/g.99136  ORF Transcript_39131/g.99136 Transcript_39131/m.99136 type:complete len:223 (-) Transcript_39131:307-975(-)